MRAIALLLCVLAAGCTQDETSKLQGSLAAVCSLDHDTVRARLYPSSLAIEFAKGPEVRIRISVDTSDEPLTGPGEIDLAAKGAVSGKCEVPPLLSGTLTLERFTPSQGTEITGHFNALFDGSSGQLSLTGTFETLLDVDGQ